LFGGTVWENGNQQDDFVRKDRNINFDIEAAVEVILTFNRASKNASIVHVYFGQDAVYPRVRKVLFESADLIGKKTKFF